MSAKNILDHHRAWLLREAKGANGQGVGASRSAAELRSGFQHEVKRGLGAPPKLAESGLSHDFAQSMLAGLAPNFGQSPVEA